jgi:hypothetical protein
MWRTSSSDKDLLKAIYLSTQLGFVNQISRMLQMQSIDRLNDPLYYVEVPWLPVLVYQDTIKNLSYIRYGDPGLVYGGVGVEYGDSSTGAWGITTNYDIIDINAVVDNPYNTTKVFTPPGVKITNQGIEFTQDITTLLTFKGTRPYTVLWFRYPKLRSALLADSLGWLFRLNYTDSSALSRSVVAANDLYVRGQNVSAIKSIFAAGCDLPTAKSVETVLSISTISPSHKTLVTTKAAYNFDISLNAKPSLGEVLNPGDSITDGVNVEEGLDVLPYISGITINIANSGGVGRIVLPNEVKTWTYDVNRPSPWRFEVSGTTSDIEAFWTQAGNNATSLGVDLGVSLGLTPGDPINPAEFYITNFIGRNCLGGNITYPTQLGVGGIVEDVTSPAMLNLLEQEASNINDSIDAATFTETIGTYNHAGSITETIDTMGSNLTYSHLTPEIFVA